MKKIEIGQMVSVLANVGVIAGIIFLALELGQNNELMEAAARQAQNDRIQEYLMQIYSVPGLADILVKLENGEPLSEVEELQLYARQLRLLRGFEAQHRESIQGAGAPVPVENWIETFYTGTRSNPPLSGVWEEAKLVLTVDFVQFIEENVVQAGPDE